jgi:hypothetical protein
MSTNKICRYLQILKCKVKYKENDLKMKYEDNDFAGFKIRVKYWTQW